MRLSKGANLRAIREAARRANETGITQQIALQNMHVIQNPGHCSYCHLESCHVDSPFYNGRRLQPMCALCGHWWIVGAHPKDGCKFNGPNNQKFFAIDWENNGAVWKPPLQLRCGGATT
jgi:hypothetical protein